jgi:hypothetical protein
MLRRHSSRLITVHGANKMEPPRKLVSLSRDSPHVVKESTESVVCILASAEPRRMMIGRLANDS